MTQAEDYQKTKQKMYDLAVEVNEMRGCYKPFVTLNDIESIDVDGDEVSIKWEVYAGCGDYEHEYFSFPASYLDDPDWRNKEIKSIEEKKIAEEKARVEKKKKMEEEQKERDLVEIARLETRIKELKEKHKIL